LLSIGHALSNINKSQELKKIREENKKMKIVYVSLDQMSNAKSNGKKKIDNSRGNSLSTNIRSKSTVKSTTSLLNKSYKIKINSLPKIPQKMPKKLVEGLLDTPVKQIKILPPMSDKDSIIVNNENLNKDTKSKSISRRDINNNGNGFRISSISIKHRSLSHRKQAN